MPLIIGNNAHEGRLFTRWLKLLPTNESMIEGLLGGLEPEQRERITAAYPGYPDTGGLHPPRRRLRVRDGGVADRRGAQHARADLRYRYDYAPRTLHWSGLGATHATELFAVFDVYRTRFGSLLTAAADGRSARRVSDDVQTRWREFGRTGVPGDDWPGLHATPTVR